MDTGTLYQFHDSRQEHILSVADSIHFYFFSHDIFIDQHRPFTVNLHRIFQILFQHFFICNDLHSSAAKYKTRPDKNRISKTGGRPDPLLYAVDSCSFRVRDAKSLNHLCLLL